jgi:arylsulfatase A-like enzyme
MTGALGLAGASLPAAPARRPPNVVVILTDDQGWGDLSINGNTNLSTPNVDSIGRDGAVFDRFQVCPVCAPTRAEFLTGRYHPRSGVRGVTTGAERMDPAERTVADLFRTAGYSTALFGKWHNGTQWPYHPNARGFQEFCGFTHGHWGQYFDTEMDHNGELVRGKGYISDDLTDRALSYMAANRRRPFFCYLAYNTPHSPMQVPDSFYRRFAGRELTMRSKDPRQEDIEHTRAALAMCENIDWNVGRALAQLDKLQLKDDTIVLYFSDNGPNGWRWNGRMKGRKGALDEGGIRSPLMVRWPGKVRPGTRVPQISAAIDLLPTLTDLCGVPAAGTRPLDGRSLRPLLLGEGAPWPDRMIFTMQNRRVSVRTQQYRLDPAGQLFDMQADPEQERNVAAERPEDAARLRSAVEAWSKEMLPLVGPDTRPYPVGEAKKTFLPARDGVPAGGVKRSGQAPNCSYFTNWTSPADVMTWDIEISRGGEFDALIYFTCPAADIGSAVELTFQEAKLSAKISEAHDPPAKGRERDRTDRGGESYWKDFRPLRLGSIRLAAGRGKLALKAVEVKGKQVAEVRDVVLIRRG